MLLHLIVVATIETRSEENFCIFLDVYVLIEPFFQFSIKANEILEDASDLKRDDGTFKFEINEMLSDNMNKREEDSLLGKINF